MKRNLLISLFFIVVSGCVDKSPKKAPEANSKTDSLSYFFDMANNDSLAFEKRQLYTKKAIGLIANGKNDSLKRVNYFKVANRYFNMQAFEDYKRTTETVIEYSKEDKDTLSLIKGYKYLADYYANKFISDSAYLYNFKVEKLYITLKDNSNVAITLLNKAIIQHNESDFLGCERSVFQALKRLKTIDNDGMLYQAYNLLGIIYGELNEYKLAEQYYDKALGIIAKSKLSPEFQFKATTLNNLGMLYQKRNNNFIAIKKFTMALQEKNLAKERPYIYAMVIDNFAYSKFRTGDNKGLPAMFYEALKIRKELNMIPGIILNQIHLSEYYSFKKDTLKSIEFAKEAYNLASSNKEERDMLATLKQLSNVEPKKALQYSAEYYKIDDSLQSSERKIRNKFARIEYETEELSLEKDKLIEQRKTLIYIGFGIILLGILIYVIRFQAAKNRELLLVQEQQQANEEIYQLMLNQQNKIEEVRQAEKKKIAQELHDGVLGKLFGTRMNLGVLNNKNDEKSITERVVFIDALKNLEQEIREISHDLNSEKTAVFNNFVLMVGNFIETQRSVCKASIVFSIDPKIEWNLVNNTAKINLYRILQEAFQNINKHSNAENVSVTFLQVENLIYLQIEDDGIGFNYNKKKNGIGLQNMLSRITGSAGTMIIETQIGKGVLLKFKLPLI